MYSLLALFFLIPLYFSHVLSPIGLSIGGNYSFERQKVYLFLILVVVSYIETLIRSPGKLVQVFKKYKYTISILFLIPILWGLYSWLISTELFWLGWLEKRHGYIFYLGIVCFTFLLFGFTKTELKQYLKWSFISVIIVSFIAVGEYVWWFFDIYQRSLLVSLYSGRSLSTLGNPNYLAWVLLFFLPVISLYRSYLNQTISHLLYLLIIVAILTTWSYIAIFLVLLFVIWHLIGYIFPRYAMSYRLTILISIVVLLIVWAVYLIDPNKLLSLSSRFVLMRESLSVMLYSPVSLLFWFWPDSLLSYFSYNRSDLIDSYFPKNMLIDSSHNIIIDILFQYGIFPLVLFGYFFYKNREKLHTPIGLAILLILIFLILNVFVVTHVILLALWAAILTTQSESINKKSK